MLIKEKRLDKKEIQKELLINDLAFKRYIKEIRNYLSFMKKDKEIYYDRGEDVYYLKKKTLDKNI